MLERFETFVAARYLRARRRQAVLSVITVISVIGVAAGVMAMIVALAVTNGFRRTLQTSLLGATPHIVVLEKTPQYGIEDWRALAPRLRALPRVTDVQPALYGQVLAAGPVQSAGAILKGVADTAALRPLVKQGSIGRLHEQGRYPGILLGTRLAEHTGMLLDSVVTLIVPQGESTPAGLRPSYPKFRVVGLIESGFYDLDNQYALTSLATAQRVLNTGDAVNAVELRLASPDDADAILPAVEAAIGPKLGAKSWREQNQMLLRALRLERTVSVITIGLIQLVAALNILIALVMSVMDRRRDIAVLMSLGARRRQIAAIFVAQGLFIGAAGVVLGLLCGYGLSFLADHYRWIRLDEEIYSMSYVPFHPRLLDALWVSATALAVSFLATIHPARNAASLRPVETLRYE